MNSIECYWHAICILVRYRTSALDCSIRLWIRTWETWPSSESASLKARVQLRRRIWKPAVQRRDRCSQIVFQFHAAMPIKIFETDVWMTRDRRNSTLPSVLWSSLILFQLLSTGPPDPVCVSYTHDRDFGNFKELNRPVGSVVSIITQIECSRCFNASTCFMHVSMWGLPEGQRELSWSGLVPTPKLRISRTCWMPTWWFVERAWPSGLATLQAHSLIWWVKSLSNLVLYPQDSSQTVSDWAFSIPAMKGSMSKIR